MKKGYALITDALVALVFFMVVAAGLVHLSSFSGISRSGYNEFLALHYSSEDVLDVLNKKGVLDDVGYMWSLSRGNRSSVYWSNASNISKRYLEDMIPYHMGYKLLMEGQEICNSSWNPNRTTEIKKDSETHATRLLVGYGENATVFGKTARAALTKIREKITSEFIYFGGFVGEGNLSQVLFLPSDATVQSAYIEVNAGNDFDLYINGLQCGGTFNPVGGGMDASIKDASGNITSCSPLISNRGSNPNTFELRFTGSNISQQYIGGGFIEVTYNTTEMDTDAETGSMRFYLPGIEGIINYYSSFYVPGWVTSINTNISFKSNYTTFFTVGDKSVFRLNGSNTSRQIYNSSADLLGSGLFSQSELSEKTVPIRVGTEGMQYSYTLERGNADVVLITDVSGSMDWRIGYNDNTAGEERSCCSMPWTSGGVIRTVGPRAYGVTSGDYDGDGNLDLISGDSDGQVELFFNDGAGGFSYQGIIRDVGSYSGGLASGDIDGDLDVDLISGDSDGQIEYFLNDGTGSFSYQGIIRDVGSYACGLALADFDGDLDLDLISGDEHGDIEYFLNDGTGSFTYQGIIRDVGSYAWGLAPADFDGDGDIDFLSGDRNGDVEYFSNDGAGSFTYQGNVDNIGSRAYGLNAEDYDSDGDMDFIRGETSGEITFYSNDGSGSFTFEEIIGDVNVRINELTSGDFDGDLDTDFVVAEHDGDLEYFNYSGVWPQWPECFANQTDNPIFFNDTQRLSLAKCLDKYFVETLLNDSDNNVALVDFSTSASDSTGVGLTNNTNILENAIDSYTEGGGTCVCCAINRAYEILNAGSTPARDKYIMVMTDGITGFHCDGCSYTSPCTCSGSCTDTSGSFDCSGNTADCLGNQCDTAINDAICAADRAHSDLNATVNSIGFGPVSTGCPNGNRTLQGIADCGNGTYRGSTNATELLDIYKSMAENMVNASTVSQMIVLGSSGTLANVTNSTLYGYPESYIEFTYNTINISSYGKISITKKSGRFNEPITCVGNVSIPPDVTVSRMKVTSYSGEHWSDYLNVSNSIYGGNPPEYRLWDYLVPYIYLGDPYIINIKSPWNKVAAGENNYLGIRTGDSQSNSTNCSADDRAIYTIRVSSILGYGNVFPVNEGCLWDIEFRNGNITDDLSIPGYYAGSKKCSYTSTNQSYDSTDAASDAVYRLLRELDIEDDGIVDVEFDPDALQFETTGAGGVRSLWGPIKVKLILWI